MQQVVWKAVLPAAAWLALVAGCASADRQPERESPPTDVAEAVMLDGRTGAPADMSALVRAATDSDVVLIGENHGHPLGLATAAAFWEQLLAESREAALSMEFFERDEQSRLDDYIEGLADEETFRRRSGRSPGNYPAGHRAMVEAAKAAERRVFASNAPRPYVRLARLNGFGRLERLTPEQQRMIRIPAELPTGRYRDEFERLMSGMGGDHGHKPPPEQIESLFRAQSLWDWTMADTLARGLEEGWRPLVHVVGRFHSDFDGGLVLALRKLRPGVRIVNISIVNERSSTLREEDRGRGDFVIYVGPSPAEAR